MNNRKIRILIIGAIIISLVIAYRIYNNIQNERMRAERISGTKVIAAETTMPQRLSISPELSFSGRLDADWQAEIAAKIDGRLEKVYVKEGDKVVSGQVLALLEQIDVNADLLAAQGNLNDAEVNLRKAELDLARYEKLYQQGAVSLQVVDDYRFARDNAAAKLKNAAGVLQGMESKVSGTAITAPKDGIVYKRYYQEGYYAKAGTPLFAVADISRLKTIIHIPEGEISGVSVGKVAEITVPSFNEQKLTGKITRISPVADLPAHTYETEISVENNQGLLAGAFADVKIQADTRKNVLTIPVNAIVMRDDQKTVFVVNEEGIVTRKVLNIGYFDDKIAEVIDGISENDIIVSGGQNKLREGSRIIINKDGK